MTTASWFCEARRYPRAPAVIFKYLIPLCFLKSEGWQVFAGTRKVMKEKKGAERGKLLYTSLFG
jgi:hypothetical protein